MKSGRKNFILFLSIIFLTSGLTFNTTKCPPKKRNGRKKKKEELPSCSICLDKVNPNSRDAKKLCKNNHVMHKECFKQYLNQFHKTECPICKSPLKLNRKEKEKRRVAEERLNPFARLAQITRDREVARRLAANPSAHNQEQQRRHQERLRRIRHEGQQRRRRVEEQHQEVMRRSRETMRNLRRQRKNLKRQRRERTRRHKYFVRNSIKQLNNTIDTVMSWAPTIAGVSLGMAILTPLLYSIASKMLASSKK